MTVAKLSFHQVAVKIEFFQRRSVGQGLNDQPVIHQMNLHGFTLSSAVDLFADPVATRNGDQFRFQTLAENPGIDIALDSSQRPPAQRAINVDVAIGDDFGAGADRA